MILAVCIFLLINIRLTKHFNQAIKRRFKVDSHHTPVAVSFDQLHETKGLASNQGERNVLQAETLKFIEREVFLSSRKYDYLFS